RRPSPFKTWYVAPQVSLVRGLYGLRFPFRRCCRQKSSCHHHIRSPRDGRDGTKRERHFQLLGRMLDEHCPWLALDITNHDKPIVGFPTVCLVPLTVGKENRPTQWFETLNLDRKSVLTLDPEVKSTCLVAAVHK